MRRTLWAGLIALAAAAPLRGQTAPPRYDLLNTAVGGSARNVSLGGAAVAFPSDYTSSFVNPAGLGGLANDGVDFGSDSNNIDNFVVDLSNPKSRAINDPINYSFVGARFVTSDWGFAVSEQTPYNLDSQFTGDQVKTKRGAIKFSDNQDQTEIKVQDHVYTVAGARTFLDRRLSLGLAVNYIQVYESYDFNPITNFNTIAPIHVNATNDAVSADFGVLWRPVDWLQLGAAYKMGYRVPFDDSRNAGLPLGVSVFHDGKYPDRVSAGFMWRPAKSLRVFGQSNYVRAMKDTVVVGSGLFPTNASTVGVGRYETIDAHWGMELIPIDEPDITIKLWAGGYLEQTGIQGGYYRYHRCAGLGFSPWFLSSSVGVDDTELYNNFVVGLGVDMLSVAQRVAKKYHLNLPIQ